MLLVTNKKSIADRYLFDYIQLVDRQFFANIAMNKFIFVLCFFTLSFIVMPATFAQEYDETITEKVVPPPLTFISKDEKKLLKAETKMKKRTKLSLELMEDRLKRSEDFLEKNEFQQSLDEVGRFRGLLVDALKYLKPYRGNKSSLKNYKKIEISLRGFIPRLEILRREMPYRYGYHIKKTMSFVRKSRTQALNPFFNDTVIEEGDN